MSETTMAMRCVEESERLEALGRLFFGDVHLTADQGERLLVLAREMGLEDEVLWAGFDCESGEMGPVVMVAPRAGRTGMVFMSRPRRRRDERVLGGLVGCVGEAVDRDRVRMMQALVSGGEEGERRALEAGGFGYLASLDYMQRTVKEGAVEPVFDDGVTLEPYGEGVRGDFLTGLEMSYEQTQDCPGLTGLRETEDVLRGHMATGRFEAGLWTLVRCEGEVAGVLLLNAMPLQRCVELVYLGIGLAHRGRGLGCRLVERAVWQCAQAGYATLSLAVDRSNAAAMALYKGSGFVRVARKEAWVKVVDGAGRA